MTSKPLWRFRVDADRNDDGTVRVQVTSDSGQIVARRGWSPIWELLRCLRDAWEKAPK